MRENPSKLYLFCLSVFVSCFLFPQRLFAQTSFTTMGNASNSGGGCYVLTPNVTWQQGTAWCNTPINLSLPLTLQYNLNFGNLGNGADGIAFVLQNQGTGVIGSFGAGIGYQGITPSMVIEFDDFQNAGDPTNDHVAITLNGDPDHTSAINSGNPVVAFPFDIEDGNWHSVQITWDPLTYTLQTYFDCQLWLTYTNDIANTVFAGNPIAWWGFTSATGGATNLQQFCYAPPFVLTINPTNPLCFGQCNGIATVANISGGVAPYTYQWSNGQTTSCISGLCAGTYTVTVTGATGCTSTDTIAIIEPTAITGNITNVVNVSCFGGNNASATVNGNGGTGAITYSWNTVPTQTNATATNLTAGNYVVTCMDANGCSITQSVTITEPPAMTISTSTAPSDCGMKNGTATVSSSGGIIPYTYLWLTNPIMTTPVAIGLAIGTYAVIVSDANGCTQSQSVSVSGGTQPVADFSFNPTVVNLLDPLTSFTDVSSGNSSIWSWDFGDTNSTNNFSVLQNPSHAYSDAGIYCITFIISDTSGMCKDTAIKCLIVEAPFTFYIPNSFSPNNDGINEFFMGYGTYIKEFHISLFDRWGNKLFESNDINKGWNGSVNNQGTLAQEDTYVWKVNIIDIRQAEHNYIGRVTVVR